MTRSVALLIAAGLTVVLLACQESPAPESAPPAQASAPPPSGAPTEAPATDADVAKNLEIFEDHDFNVMASQNWEELSKSHSRNVLVHWADGRTTTGLDRHTEELKALHAFAPNMRVTQHSVKFGSGEWTSVIGVLEGNFLIAPMPRAGEKPIRSTSRPFKLLMNTVARWNAEGQMIEEYLFYDNESLLRQINPQRQAGGASPK